MSQLHPVKERVTTIGEKGKRFWLYPAPFKGQWLNRRKVLAWLLIVIYFLLPWVEVGGHQAILLNVAERRFAFFGLTIWPQDLLIFWFFLITGLIGIFLITALFGRLWCGWACPQTIFLEHVFRKIESVIEGPATKRKKLDKGPWNFKKIGLKSLKWFIFIVVSSHFANTLLCYFVGTEAVLEMSLHQPEENWSWFVFMFFINALFLLNFGWFREQFCIIACPYGRFQSVLLDQDSTIVGYDYNRGEPREKFRKGKAQSGGDCIDCNRCVAVCPTGIDIRMGLQMECINCTACMDACDEIMDNVKRPKGLIGYTSLAELENKKRKFIRPRVIFYSLLCLVFLSAGTIMWQNRSEATVRILRPPGTTFTVTEDRIQNLFQLKVVNKLADDIAIRLQGPDSVKLVVPLHPFPVKGEAKATTSLFISSAKAGFPANGKLRVPIEVYLNEELLFETRVTLFGPEE